MDATLVARVSELTHGLAGALAAIESAADQCDTWADQSLQGVWSSHQVASNRALADRLRRQAAAYRRCLYKAPAALPSQEP